MIKITPEAADSLMNNADLSVRTAINQASVDRPSGCPSPNLHNCDLVTDEVGTPFCRYCEANIYVNSVVTAHVPHKSG